MPKNAEVVVSDGVGRREVVRAAILEIAEAKGRVDPQDVVAAARDEASPLHEFFTWDDTLAGERYRLMQAGVLIRRIKVTIVRQDPETRSVDVESVRELQSPGGERNRKGGAKKGGSFIPASRIANDPALRAQLVATVWSELQAVRKRYAEVSELAAVWKAIDRAAPKGASG